jgi:bZIP transcription factor
MLSYFLGGSDLLSSNPNPSSSMLSSIPPTNFTTIAPSQHDLLSPPPPNKDGPHEDDHGDNKSSYNDDDDGKNNDTSYHRRHHYENDDPTTAHKGQQFPPPTPAVVHFYSATNRTPQSSNVYHQRNHYDNSSSHIHVNSINHLNQPHIPSSHHQDAMNKSISAPSVATISTTHDTIHGTHVEDRMMHQQLPHPTTTSTSSPTLSNNATTLTTTSQSSSSSLSSLPNGTTTTTNTTGVLAHGAVQQNHQHQLLYHQQLQMQRVMAGSGGGSSGTARNNHSSMLPGNVPPQPSSPLVHPQMLLYPFPISTVVSGGVGNNPSSYNSSHQVGGWMMQPFVPMYTTSTSGTTDNGGIGDVESPLTPSAMIGGMMAEHENLFLPRSNSFYETATTGVSTNSSNNSQHPVMGGGDMGPPLSRHPSHLNIQQQQQQPSPVITTHPIGGYVWPPPPPATTFDTIVTNNPNNHTIPPPPLPPTASPVNSSSAGGTGVSTSSNHQNHTASSSNTMPMMTFPLYSHIMASSQQEQQQQSAMVPNIQPYMYSQAATMALQQQRSEAVSSTSTSSFVNSNSVQQEEESEEKRSKRLERNRESARKCRLKKKERLLTLGAQVTELHSKIEHQRRLLINSMVPAMQQCRHKEIQLLFQNDDDGVVAQKVLHIVRDSGPSSSMMRSVLEFQYSTLKDITLPQYQKLWLWFTLQRESFFTAGKELYYLQQQQKGSHHRSNKTNGDSAVLASGTAADNNIENSSSNEAMTASASSSSHPSSRSTVIKISSKQIGDELMNGTSASTSSSSTNKKDGKTNRKRESNTSASGGNGDGTAGALITSASATDAARMWPLFCYELKLSVDQEERMVGKYKQILSEDVRWANSHQDIMQHSSTPQPFYHHHHPRSLTYVRSQMAVAVTTTESLGKAVGSLSHVVAQREERTLLGILNPKQVALYQAWLWSDSTNNRERCRRAVVLQMRNGTVQMNEESMDTTSSNTKNGIQHGATKEMSLHDISRRLREVLQISSEKSSGNSDDNRM